MKLKVKNSILTHFHFIFFRGIGYIDMQMDEIFSDNIVTCAALKIRYSVLAPKC